MLDPHMATAGKRPLVIDLDSAVLRSNLLVELLFGFIGGSPLQSLQLLFWLRGGKVELMRQLEKAVGINVATLPYDEAVVSRVREARAEGRRIYLVSGYDEGLVRAIADHLGGFDGLFTSEAAADPAARANAVGLVAALGENGFDYIGGNRSRVLTPDAPMTSADSGTQQPRPWRAMWRLLRPHQWAKNALLGVAVLTAHQFTWVSLWAALGAVAFSACASAAYIFNDLVDLQADRDHPSKRMRPFASGEVSFAEGATVGCLCLAFAIAIAAAISWRFLGVLVLYFALTIAYSLVLKRKLLVDVITLAILYTIRVVAGAVAIRAPMSEWLLTFSLFIFLSLALVKRYSELATRFDCGLPDPANRNYRTDDLSVVFALAAASGYCAVVVLTLYLSSDTVRELYSHPSVLWLGCPICIYWISRMLMLSHRRALHDDPLVFAITDKISWATATLLIIIGFVAA
jgi:4-hydroxybenzoate polyprenyltransferase